MLESLLAFSIFGFVFFDLVIFTIAFLILMYTTASEEYGFFSFVGSLLMLFFIYKAVINVNSFSEFISHIPYYITIVLIWLGIGCLWFFFRWNKHSKEERERFEKSWSSKVEDLKHKGKPAPTNDDKINHADGYIPKAMHEKEKISIWIIFWPFSMLSYLFGDLLKDFMDLVIRSLSGIASRITRRHFGDLMR